MTCRAFVAYDALMTRSLTINQYAAEFGLNPQTVRSWARGGHAPFGVRFVRLNPSSKAKAMWRVEVDVPVAGKEDDS